MRTMLLVAQFSLAIIPKMVQAQSPEISTQAQAQLYGYRMESMCNSGRMSAKPSQNAGVCKCVGNLAYTEGLDGQYATRWDRVSREEDVFVGKLILTMPLSKQGRADAVASAALPYLVSSIVEDQYDQACHGAHGYLNHEAPGLVASQKKYFKKLFSQK